MSLPYYPNPFSPTKAAFDSLSNKKTTPPYTFRTNAHKTAFCETCQTIKPTNSKPKVKGWKCTDCENTNEQS